MTENKVTIKLKKIADVRKKEVFLKDAAEIYCKNPAIETKCRALKIFQVPEDRKQRYILSALEISRMVEALESSIQAEQAGEKDLVIAYEPPGGPVFWKPWLKAFLICLVCFFGGAFAIMTFNNDVNVTSVFDEVYTLVTGKKPEGVTLLEAGYSIGLALGILVFFNHFAAWKSNADPTPLEVEMRLYEDNVIKTLVDGADRKEKQHGA